MNSQDGTIRLLLGVLIEIRQSITTSFHDNAHFVSITRQTFCNITMFQERMMKCQETDNIKHFKKLVLI